MSMINGKLAMDPIPEVSSTKSLARSISQMVVTEPVQLDRALSVFRNNDIEAIESFKKQANNITIRALQTTAASTSRLGAMSSMVRYAASAAMNSFIFLKKPTPEARERVLSSFAPPVMAANSIGKEKEVVDHLKQCVDYLKENLVESESRARKAERQVAMLLKVLSDIQVSVDFDDKVEEQEDLALRFEEIVELE